MDSYYFDAGVFITPIIKNREQRVIDMCISWLRKIGMGQIRAYTSYLTWDELVYVVYRSYCRNDVTWAREKAVESGKKFLSLPNIEFIPVDKKIIVRSQELIERYNIKPRDSIHASSAFIYTESAIVTLDVQHSDFKKLKDANGKLLINIEEIY